MSIDSINDSGCMQEKFTQLVMYVWLKMCLCRSLIHR